MSWARSLGKDLTGVGGDAGMSHQHSSAGAPGLPQHPETGSQVAVDEVRAVDDDKLAVVFLAALQDVLQLGWIVVGEDP